MGSTKMIVLLFSLSITTSSCFPAPSLNSQGEVREKRGTLGGAALGAAAGTLVAGPLGTVVGGLVGGFIGHEAKKSDQLSAVNSVRNAPRGGVTNPSVAVAPAAPAVIMPATVNVVPAVPAVVVPVEVATGVNPSTSGFASSSS